MNKRWFFSISVLVLLAFMPSQGQAACGYTEPGDFVVCGPGQMPAPPAGTIGPNPLIPPIGGGGIIPPIIPLPDPTTAIGSPTMADLETANKNLTTAFNGLSNEHKLAAAEILAKTNLEAVIPFGDNIVETYTDIDGNTITTFLGFNLDDIALSVVGINNSFAADFTAGFEPISELSEIFKEVGNLSISTALANTGNSSLEAIAIAGAQSALTSDNFFTASSVGLSAFFNFPSGQNLTGLEIMSMEHLGCPLNTFNNGTTSCGTTQDISVSVNDSGQLILDYYKEYDIYGNVNVLDAFGNIIGTNYEIIGTGLQPTTYTSAAGLIPKDAFVEIGLNLAGDSLSVLVDGVDAISVSGIGISDFQNANFQDISTGIVSNVNGNSLFLDDLLLDIN